mgnify:CR=1 FL=1
MLQFKFVLIIIVCIIFSCFVFSPAAAAKKRCKPLLEKLHNVQSLQRNSYSGKRGLSLRDREDKARNNWWQCENSSAKAKQKTKGKGNKKSKKNTASGNIQVKRVKSKKINAGTPFKTSNAIVIRSKYQGQRKQAWLKYYQQPNQCSRPKSLPVFAFCSENKQTQRLDFEKHYNK